MSQDTSDLPEVTETLTWYDPDKHSPPIVEQFADTAFHGTIMGYYPQFIKRQERSLQVWSSNGEITRWMVSCGDGSDNIKPARWRFLRSLEK
jgi:hypothetical protein